MPNALLTSYHKFCKGDPGDGQSTENGCQRKNEKKILYCCVSLKAETVCFLLA